MDVFSDKLVEKCNRENMPHICNIMYANRDPGLFLITDIYRRGRWHTIALLSGTTRSERLLLQY